MDITTRKQFQELPEDSKVQVTYESKYITNFTQTFSQMRYPEVLKISAKEWEELWDNYHVSDMRKVTFKVI